MKRSFDPAGPGDDGSGAALPAELERDLERIWELNCWFGSYRLVLGFIRSLDQTGRQIARRRWGKRIGRYPAINCRLCAKD